MRASGGGDGAEDEALVLDGMCGGVWGSLELLWKMFKSKTFYRYSKKNIFTQYNFFFKWKKIELRLLISEIKN